MRQVDLAEGVLAAFEELGHRPRSHVANVVALHVQVRDPSARQTGEKVHGALQGKGKKWGVGGRR